MTADDRLSALAAKAGIFPRFRDLEQQVRPTSPDTYRALLRACGIAAGTPAEVSESLQALEAEEKSALLGRDEYATTGEATVLTARQEVAWHVCADTTGEVLAAGRSEGCRISLPPLVSGVHTLHLDAGGEKQSFSLIVSPRQTPSLSDLGAGQETWGIVAALYGLHSEENAGPGDYSDLAELARTAGRSGAGFLGINPVHALGWSDNSTISPYSPSHRGFLHTGHIAVPGRHRSCSPGPLIDYATHRPLHDASLAAAFDLFGTSRTTAEERSFDAFCRNGGKPLLDFARFETLSETHGADWRVWPDHLRIPQASAPGAPDDRIRFHLWLQWMADAQLRAAQSAGLSAGMPVGLYLDLAVGARLGGAEAWGAQASQAQGVSIGAPPDHLSPAGQNWQLTGYAPVKLRAQQYAPFRQVLAQSMRHCGLLRIDHALGMNRSYWIPDDGTPGGYIRQPFRSLMAVIAIEAERAGTAIVGEDLGLVPTGFRNEMAARGLYGYTVLQYEKTRNGRFRRPSRLRSRSLACFGTHDTPTLQGYRAGDDIRWWEKLGWISGDEVAKAKTARKKDLATLPGGGGGTAAQGDSFRDGVHRALSRSAAALVAVQLDDVLNVTDAQNLPGTISEHPNWQRRYPARVEELAGNPGLKRTAQIMARAGRSAGHKDSRKETGCKS
ncbi:4-alpha-glucanotransferase [uncultured Roseobacter sp.]|uniref:4-alpha-glucanotransferase n=1 Tax=uncultured Roseobacter sp. TaxID=114847 RepID=UPI00263410E8|nr:4-alpha-glucanotransferase [uncultured Roseobacter sp.]